MGHSITICDETTSGEVLQTIELEFLTEQITVRELIRSRVFQEVKDYNLKSDGSYKGLVQPTDSERILNGFRIKPNRKIDWEKQAQKAIEAFESRQLLVLVDERQFTDLDEQIEVNLQTKVAFVQLVILVGG